jgi:uncharacterized glyoxalase superfamily protein PhnB
MRVSYVNLVLGHIHRRQVREDDAELRKEDKLPTKGGGLSLYIKVDDVEDFYKAVVARGMRPSSEPRRMPTGHRGFVLRDADGYKLVFFAKK